MKAIAATTDIQQITAEQLLTLTGPLVDPDALNASLNRLGRDLRGDPPKLRSAALALLKAEIKSAHSLAKARLDAERRGRTVAEGLSNFTDTVVRAVYEFTVAYVYPAANPSSSERLAILATGGYGRGLMAPKSDLDLLFLLPYKETAWTESVVEHMLYLLWDLGLKVGHAVRNVDQTIRAALDDMTVRTALIDHRLILGEGALVVDFSERFRAEVLAGSVKEFIAAKYFERSERHRKSGTSRYAVEPNLKDGIGGLRDLHLIHWIDRYHQESVTAGQHDRPAPPDGTGSSLLSADEWRAFRMCEDLLWTVRCHLHFLTKRPEERLTFDVQLAVAEALDISGKLGRRPAERLMRRYFLTAREVGSLIRTFSSSLELLQLKAEPRPESALAAVNWETRMLLRRRTDFRIENGRIRAATEEIFQQNPINLIRIFELAGTYDVGFHPDAFRLIRQSLRLIDDRLRQDPEANRIFLALLTARTDVEVGLRRMNEAGVLGRFIPDFGRIVAMMQFNSYHHYTVDEHTIRAIGLLAAIEEGKLGEDHPLATTIFRDVEMRRALYVAVLLHDIGKGRMEDHSILGARIARDLCPRLGLSKAETETVAWLVEKHLVMSIFAQSRDLSDPQTIRDFASIVQSPERLRLLLILTVADIRSVGPGVWNGWKGQLLRTLYFETEPVLAGGHTRASNRGSRIAAAKSDVRTQLFEGLSADRIERAISRLPDAYWLRTDVAKIVEHIGLLDRAERLDQPVAFAVKTDAFTAITELTLVAPDVTRLLSLFAGACASADANILGAHVSTTADGLALDSFLLKRDLDEDAEQRRAKRIGETIERLLAGTISLESLMQHRPALKARLKAFSIEPQVVINNRLSEEFTVLEVSGLDRPGLLFDLTSALSDLKLDIRSAHIATYGERAVDVFYVTGQARSRVTEPDEQSEITAKLLGVLAAGGG